MLKEYKVVAFAFRLIFASASTIKIKLERV